MRRGLRVGAPPARRGQAAGAAFAALALGLACCNGGDIIPGSASSDKGNGGSAGAARSAAEADAAVVTALTASANACAAKGKVWMPSVTTGAGDAANASGTGSCGAAPVPFCCTLDALKAHLPAADAFVPKITALTAQHYQIYACSQEDPETVKVHLIKRDAGQNYYSEVTLAQLGGSGTAAGLDGAPAKATLADASIGESAVASLADSPIGVDLATATGTGTGTSAPAAATCPVDLGAILAGKTPAAPGGAPASVFDTTVNPLLKASCDGSGCHAKGSQSPTAYIDAPDAVKAIAKTMIDDIQSGRMPLGTPLPAADKAKLIDALKSL